MVVVVDISTWSVIRVRLDPLGMDAVAVFSNESDAAEYVVWKNSKQPDSGVTYIVRPHFQTMGE